MGILKLPNGSTIHIHEDRDDGPYQGIEFNYIMLEDTRMNGTVERLVADRGFGFIRDDHKKDWFFHRTDVLPDKHDFDHVRVGDRVDFEPEQGPKGPRATQVRRY